MILWASKVDEESEPKFQHLGRRAWRWVLEVEPLVVSLNRQFRCERDGSEWSQRSSLEYFTVWIDRRFRLGELHTYYDGPHCQFSLGWLHIGWSYWWCTKCMPEEK